MPLIPLSPLEACLMGIALMDLLIEARSALKNH